jgi:hypothetical protein
MRNFVLLLSIILLSLQFFSDCKKLNKDKSRNSLHSESEALHKTSSNISVESSNCTMMEGKCVPAPSFLKE